MPDLYADPVSIGILVQNGVSGAYADPWSSGRHIVFFEKGISDPYEDLVPNGIPVEKDVSDAFVDVHLEVKKASLVFCVIKRPQSALFRCTVSIQEESASPVETHKIRWFQSHI